jgi:glyoxalase superfamily protein
LVGLGASVERRTRHDDPQVYFVVMHDPEGNEFCVG